MIQRKYKSILAFICLIALVSSCQKSDDAMEFDPDAGISFENVENEGYQVQLSAQAAPAGQTGTWRVYSGVNGTFDDVNNPETIFRGEPGVSYQIGWELSVGKQYESDIITVSFKSLSPVIYHADGDTIWNNRSLVLEAEAAKYGASGQWEIVDGDNARIELADSCIGHFIGEEHSDYTIKWTLSYGSQSVSQEFSFVTDEFSAMAGDDQLDIITNKDTDELKYFSLDALLPAGASGLWTLIDGAQGKVMEPTKANSVFEGVADTVYTLTWNVNLEEEQSIDTVKVRFRGKWAIWIDPLDNQEYRTTIINGIEWMADNYNGAYEEGVSSWYYGYAERATVEDGIPLETEELRKKYGRLYTWVAAYYATPEGWRLPTMEEFEELENYLGGPLYAHERIMEGGDSGLELNFSGYYQMYNFDDPSIRAAFKEQDSFGTYWSSDYYEDLGKANGKSISSEYPGFGLLSVSPSVYGFSVRYVRDTNE